MEDKRIIKTKKNIKRTLTEMLRDVRFEKITVSELCRRGQVSRITFYTYYDDKYSLVADMCKDFIAEANADYHNVKDPAQLQGSAGYIRHLECVINLFYRNIDFFSHTHQDENPYLYSILYSRVYESLIEYYDRHHYLVTKNSPAITATFVCNGLFGVLNECTKNNVPHPDALKLLIDLYRDVLDSDLFLPPEEVVSK